jgi:hypothetical protein
VILSKFWSRYDLQNFRKRKFLGDDQGELSKGTVSMRVTSRRGQVTDVPIHQMRSFVPLLLLTVDADAGRTQVGMMYEGWHAPAYWGRSPFATNATVEDVVRSNSTMPMQVCCCRCRCRCSTPPFHAA